MFELSVERSCKYLASLCRGQLLLNISEWCSLAQVRVCRDGLVLAVRNAWRNSLHWFLTHTQIGIYVVVIILLWSLLSREWVMSQRAKIVLLVLIKFKLNLLGLGHIISVVLLLNLVSIVGSDCLLTKHLSMVWLSTVRRSMSHESDSWGIFLVLILLSQLAIWHSYNGILGLWLRCISLEIACRLDEFTSASLFDIPCIHSLAFLRSDMAAYTNDHTG